jgi:hypothetical protein
MSNCDHYAIVVGIKTYPDSWLGNVCGAERDAKEFCEWLLDSEGGDLKKENVDLLCTSDFYPHSSPQSVKQAHPIPDEIYDLFRRHISRAGEVESIGKRLYIFVAGHGFADPQNMSSVGLYTADAEKLYPCHIAVTYVAEWFARQALFDEIILIMDCCRSHHLQYKVSEPYLPELQGSRNASKVRIFRAFAVGWGQTARAKKFDDGKYHGIFTEALINALRNANPNDKGEVSGEIVKNYVHNTIHEIAEEVEVAPPDIDVSDPDIVFTKRKAGATSPVRIFVTAYTGEEKLVLLRGDDNGLSEYCRVVAASPMVSLNLAPGLYKVIVESTNRTGYFEVPSDVQVDV